MQTPKKLISFFILMIFNQIIYGQNDFIPYALANGKWTYVKKGTVTPVLEKQFYRTNGFSKDGNAIIYDVEVYNENNISTRFYTHVAYLINKDLKILKKVSDSRRGSKPDFDYFIEPLYDEVANYTYYIFQDYDKTEDFRGILDSLGKEIYPAKDFNRFEGISNGRIIGRFSASNGSKDGLLDLNGNVILPISPIEFLDNKFKNGLIPYRVGDKCGFMDKDANEIIFPQYKYIYPFTLGFSKIGNPDERIINTQNKVVNVQNIIKSLTGTEFFSYKFIEKGIDSDSPDLDFIAVIHYKRDFYWSPPHPLKNEELILLNKNFKIFKRLNLPRDPNNKVWELESEFKNTLKLKSGDYIPRYYLWNYNNGKLDNQVDRNVTITEGLYSFKDEDLGWGYKNINQEIVIDAKFYECTPFKYGMALVKDIRGWSLIDKKGNTILKIGNKYVQYDLRIFNENLIFCKDKKNDKDFFIDLNGFEYRDNEENLSRKKEIAASIKKTKDSLDLIEISKLEIIKKKNELEKQNEYNKLLEVTKYMSVGDLLEDGIILKKFDDGRCLLISSFSKIATEKNLKNELSFKGKGWRLPNETEAKLVREMNNDFPNFKKKFNAGSSKRFWMLASDTKTNGYWLIDTSHKLKKDVYGEEIGPGEFWLVPVKIYPQK
jgi:hypothetical protein